MKANPQAALQATSFITHLKNNRIEYIGLLIIAHLLNVPAQALSVLGGVC